MAAAEQVIKFYVVILLLCLCSCTQGGGSSSHQDKEISVPEAPHAKLYLLKAGKSHQALVLIGGWQGNEWLTNERLHLAFDFMLANFEAIDRQQEIPLWDELSIYGLAYDTSCAPGTIASDYRVLAAKDKLLAKADTRFVTICHSFGGWVGACIEGQTLTSLGSLDAGTPWLGAVFPDPDLLEKGLSKIYPIAGKNVIGTLATAQVDFGSASLQWMRPESAERKSLLSKVDFSKHYLYVGEHPPAADDIIRRNVGLFALFDTFKWKGDSIYGSAQANQAYGLGSRIILAATGEASDGVTPKPSGSAEGFCSPMRVRDMGESDHSEIITGMQGDEALHRQMYQDLVGLLMADPRRNMPHFDVWLPMVPTLDLPSEWAKRLETSTLAFVQDKKLVVAGATGESEQPLSSLGTLQCSWPKWVDKRSLLFTGQSGTESDIYLIQDGSQVVKLTHNGKSELATPLKVGAGFVMVSDGQLTLRSFGGLTRTLVKDKVNLTTPPVVMGEAVYFSHADGRGEQGLYKVGLHASHLPLASAEKIADATYLPQRLGSTILAVEAKGVKTHLVLVAGGLSSGIDVATQYLNQHNLKHLECVLVDSRFTNIYVGLDGEIRSVSRGDLLKAGKSGWQGMLTPGKVTLPAMETLLPVRSKGVQLDVK